jgi:hypothetical protein
MEKIYRFITKHYHYFYVGWIMMWIIAGVIIFNSGSEVSTEIKLFVHSNLIGLVTAIFIIPFVIRVYQIYVTLAVKRRELLEIEISQVELSIDQSTQLGKLKTNLYQIAKDSSSDIGKFIAEELSNNASWAANALREAAILGGSISIFGQRINHFRQEKELVAKNFFNFLNYRLNWLAKNENYSKIVVILDSGTTILPLFEHLAHEAVNQLSIQDDFKGWQQKVEIITNNIPGIEDLIKYGKENPNDRYSEVALKCKVLPGQPLAVYSAIVGEDTVNALEKINNNHVYIIGITTGNFVRLFNGQIAPLARGKGHCEFKAKLCEISNEVYIIATLGKIILSNSTKEFNNDLRYSEKMKTQDKQPYKEISIETKSTKTKLVTTSRETNESIMYKFSKKVEEEIYKIPPHIICKDEQQHEFNIIAEKGINDIPNFLFNFKNDKRTDEQELEELPHDYLRVPRIKEKYFCIND